MKMTKEPYMQHWAIPGGLVKPEETPEEGAIRQLQTRTGIKNIYLEQLFTFGKPDRDPAGRVVSVAYFALYPKENADKFIQSQNLKWFDLNDLPQLAYDHKEMLDVAKERLKAKLEYTNIVVSLFKNELTLTELQKTYEIILDKNIDKRNFRKKIINAKILEKASTKKQYGAHRPAQLYKFKDRKVKIIDML